MPNVKVYMDEALLAATAGQADTALVKLRGFLCESLGVTEAACHIVVLGVRSVPGQTPVNVELALLRGQERTRDRMAAICGRLRDLMAEWLGCRIAVRCAMMEPEHYIVAR